MNESPISADFVASPPILTRGQPYPFPIAKPDGATAHFLAKGASVLQISLPGMQPNEEIALSRGKLMAGFLAADGAIMWVFQFLRSIRSPTLTYDCPFDIRSLPPSRREIPAIEPRMRPLPFEIHAIDDRGVLRVRRNVALPPALTRDFLSAVAVQLSTDRSGEAAYLLWRRREPLQLAAQCTMQRCLN